MLVATIIRDEAALKHVHKSFCRNLSDQDISQVMFGKSYSSGIERLTHPFFSEKNNLEPCVAELIEDHGQMVFNTAFRVLGNVADAEDVTQEVYLEALSGSQNHDVVNWGGWLRKLTVFRALDHRRKMRRESPDAWLAEDVPAVTDSPHDATASRETAENLRQKVADLPHREGVVFTLRYCEQLSNQEIGDLLGISGEAVSTALHKARTKLASFVQEHLAEGKR